MDKSHKRIKRRDFIRVMGGAWVATELGVTGCSERNSTPSGTGSDATAGGFGQHSGLPVDTDAIQLNGASGSIGAAGGGSAGTFSNSGAVTGGSEDDGPLITGGSGGSTKPSAGAGSGATGGIGGESDAGPGSDSGTSDTGGSEVAVDSGPLDNGKSKVYLVKPVDRISGISQVLAMAGGLGFTAGRDVVLKPNFNSTYELPATTHDDTIRTIVAELKTAGAGNIILGESSGSTTGSVAPTETVIRAKRTLNLCSELGIDFVSYDDPTSEYETFQFDGMMWTGGLAIPKLIRSDRVKILMPCCKTHFLGDYSFSLKLAVGLVPRSRRLPDMHLMSLQEKVADINKGFEPDLIIMDAMLCFIDNGPDTGTTAAPGLILAATDRVAMDAVGVAILKAAGSNTAPIRGKIFETRQIARAVENGLGATSPDDIELIGDDDATVAQLRSILDAG